MPITGSKFEEFLKVKTTNDLAKSFGISVRFFNRTIYGTDKDEKYTEFSIKSGNAKERSIASPNKWLKIIQQKLNKILQEGANNKICVHGFVIGRSIVTNAKNHIKKKFLVNIDLKDFFPSIHFGRVRGLFLSKPFNLPDEIAIVLANICCHKQVLPQGAPTSPTISNYICWRLDNDLMKFAIENKLTYTRYADDITFSTSLNSIPNKLGKVENNEFILSKLFIKLITENGFQVNPDKTRFATKYNRQRVTGITTNSKLNVSRKYIRNIRATLNAWERYGLNATAKEHFSKYMNLKNRKNIEAAFRKKIIGKIGFVGSVKGREDDIYINLVSRVTLLDPKAPLSIVLKETATEKIPMIYGEGKTDWKHLKAALLKLKSDGFYRHLNVKFREYDKDFEINNIQLLSICTTLSKEGQNKNIIICIFDKDVESINKKVIDGEPNSYKHWGNKVYSLLLPKPSHRNFNKVSIEHFYSDEEIKTYDTNRRRLFLSSEFNKETGYSNTEELYIKKLGVLQNPNPVIIDNEVFDRNFKNVALSKNVFANYILKKEKDFDTFTFDHFKPIFNLIESIINNWKI